MMPTHITAFDTEHQAALSGLWFLGDVHGEFQWIAHALMAAKELPSHITFLGDVDIAHKPLREILEPMRRVYPSVQVAFIHGNHDADSYEAWECLHDAGDDAIKLHGKVTTLNGIRVGALGGVFLGKVWNPPEPPKFGSKEAAMNRGAFQFRGGQRPSPTYLAAIYPDDYDRMTKLRAPPTQTCNTRRQPVQRVSLVAFDVDQALEALSAHDLSVAWGYVAQVVVLPYGHDRV